MSLPRKLKLEDIANRLNGSYVPDVIKGTAAIVIVTVALRMYPMRSGMILSVIARRIRATHQKNYTRIYLDGIPPDLWSVRIPHSKRKE
jgi:hypothetical protein